MLRAEISAALEAQYSGQNLNNLQKLAYLDTNSTGSSVINKDAAFATEIIDIITNDTGSNPAATNAISFSMWAQIDEPASGGVRRNLVSIGKNNSSEQFLSFGITKASGLNPTRFNFEVSTTNGVSTTVAKWTAAIDAASAYSTGPNHILLSFFGESGSIASEHFVDFWFNGTQLVTTSSVSPKDMYDIDFAGTYNFRGTSVNRTGQQIITFGGKSTNNGASSSDEMSGSIDQITIWKSFLSNDPKNLHIDALYNSGEPTVITASSVYTDDPSSLVAWYTIW